MPAVDQLPWFLVAFVLLVIVNSLGWVPAAAHTVITPVSSWCLLTAVAALGVKTSRTKALWSREPMPPSIYLRALTLQSVRAEPGVVREIERLVELDPDATISLWDSFNELDLTRLGFVREAWVGEWWIKPASILPAQPDGTLRCEVEQ